MPEAQYMTKLVKQSFLDTLKVIFGHKRALSEVAHPITCSVLVRIERLRIVPTRVTVSVHYTKFWEIKMHDVVQK